MARDPLGPREQPLCGGGYVVTRLTESEREQTEKLWEPRVTDQVGA